MSKEPKKAGGLTLRHKVGYAMGDLGGCMTFALMGSMVTRYYTNILHVDTLVLATMLFIWNVWDALNDPMMGMLMDKIYSKHYNKNGKFRPWLLRSAPLLAITFIVLWTVPTFFEGTAMLAVLFICKLLYEACYTMFNIPMGSLLSAMANTDGERATLSSARGFGGMIGNMVPLFIFPILLNVWGETSTAYGVGAAVCAAIGFVCCLLHYFWTEERNVSYAPVTEQNKVKFTDIFTVLRKNRPFLALCLYGIFACTSQYVSQTLGTYMYADVLGDIGYMSTTTVLTMPIMIITLLVAPKLAQKFGLERTIRTCLVISFTMNVVLFIAHMLLTVNPYFHIIWFALSSGFGSVGIYMQWGLVAETTDYNELVTGKRNEGTIYGTFNLSRRVGQTIGNSAAVLALGWIGYDDVLAAAGGVQSAGTILGIKVLCVLLPAIFCIGSWAAFRFVWNMTPEMRAKLAAFKSGQGTADETPANKD